MTGGDIFKIINDNEEYSDFYKNDKIFKNTIDAFIDAADEGPEKIANITVNMVYCFQFIFSTILTTIVDCNDQKTIDAVNNVMTKLMSEYDKE